MASSLLGFFETAVHQPSDLDWDALPAGCIVQMHWHRTPELLQLLERREMQAIGIMRHPLDVLLSILHFCSFEPETARWLDGEGGTEAAIVGRTPADPAFLEYALSDRAHSLLSVTAEWLTGGYPCIRYDMLVSEPVATLESLFSRNERALPIETVVSNHTMESFAGRRPTSTSGAASRVSGANLSPPNRPRKATTGIAWFSSFWTTASTGRRIWD